MSDTPSESRVGWLHVDTTLTMGDFLVRFPQTHPISRLIADAQE